MSLVALAIRTTVVRALKGETLAGNRVFDSLIVPWDQLAQEGPEPIIIVSTDDDESKPRMPHTRDRARELDIVIEIILAGAVEVTEGAAHVVIPHTDAGLEATLDLIAWQVRSALKDPTSAWAELYRTFRGEVRARVARRGANAENGVKDAIRQIILTVDPLQEPERGADAVPTPWDGLVAAMRADDELVSYGDLLAALLTGTTLPPWQIIQRQFGQTRAVMDAVGLGALPGGEAEPAVSQITLGTERGDLVETPGSLPIADVPPETDS